MPESLLNQHYTREQVRRLLELSERELASWEKLELVPVRDQYSFADLLALRTLKQLRVNRTPLHAIRQAIAALRERLEHITNPLLQLKIVSDGKKMQVLVDGQAMEPVSGQLLLNFDQVELKRLLEFPPERPEQKRAQQQALRREAESWFERGVELEQRGAPFEEIVAAYTQASTLDPAFGGPLVNLGTVYFRARKWRDAERYYRQALAANPEYPLAHFNLANLYEEQGDRDKALGHYQEALTLHPQYADAHYNIALLYQNAGQWLKAVTHWQTFLKLDPTGSWADIARRELDKLRRMTVVHGARSSRRAGADQRG